MSVFNIALRLALRCIGWQLVMLVLHSFLGYRRQALGHIACSAIVRSDTSKRPRSKLKITHHVWIHDGVGTAHVWPLALYDHGKAGDRSLRVNLRYAGADKRLPGPMLLVTS